MKHIIMAAILSSAVAPAAFAGSEGVGGGDLCENRIQVIRDDLKSWITKGGHRGLSLPSGWSFDQYGKEMLSAIDTAKVRCVGPGDKGYPVEVSGTPKECRFDRKGRSSQITCDTSKFQKRSESDQYVLIHHEYAGLAGIENPNSDQSNYATSNQLSSYLVSQTVKRLAVVPNRSSTPTELEGWVQLDGREAVSIARSLQDALALTQFSDCSIKIEEAPSPEYKSSCEGEEYYWATATLTPTAGQQSKELWFIPGHFNCNSKLDEPGTFSLRSTEGAPRFRQHYKGNLKRESEAEKRMDLRADIDIEFDSTETRIKKVSMRKYALRIVNTGTVGNPKWTTKQDVLRSLVCNAK